MNSKLDAHFIDEYRERNAQLETINVELLETLELCRVGILAEMQRNKLTGFEYESGWMSYGHLIEVFVNPAISKAKGEQR